MCCVLPLGDHGGLLGRLPVTSAFPTTTAPSAYRAASCSRRTQKDSWTRPYLLSTLFCTSPPLLQPRLLIHMLLCCAQHAAGCTPSLTPRSNAPKGERAARLATPCWQPLASTPCLITEAPLAFHPPVRLPLTSLGSARMMVRVVMSSDTRVPAVSLLWSTLVRTPTT